MNLLILITTYNRPAYLAELLPQLRGAGRNVWVIDDGSIPRVEIPKACRDFVELKREAHHGRENYGALVAKYHKLASVSSAKRVAMIPDDVLPAVSDPFAVAEQIWQEIRAIDPHGIMLNMLLDKRGIVQQWRAGYPVRVTDRAWLTNWNDLCFYTTPDVLQKAPNRYAPPHSAYMGSGVGSRFTWALREHGNLYQVASTLWHHREGESVMCPDERRTNPL